MKSKYKYIEFTFTDQEFPRKGGSCINKKSKTVLGYWDYYAPWRQYVIEFLEDCVFNTSCLRDIADFLGQLNNKAYCGKQLDDEATETTEDIPES